MADRDGLENRCARKGTVGSNPTLSAIDTQIATICEVRAIRCTHIQCFDPGPPLA